MGEDESCAATKVTNLAKGGACGAPFTDEEIERTIFVPIFFSVMNSTTWTPVEWMLFLPHACTHAFGTAHTLLYMCV